MERKTHKYPENTSSKNTWKGKHINIRKTQVTKIYGKKTHKYPENTSNKIRAPTKEIFKYNETFERLRKCDLAVKI